MTVTLLNEPTDEYVDIALGECWDKGCYADQDKREKRIRNNALKLKHESVLEFMDFVFQIEASTKVLLEMTRHRHANYACKSSRYTLNKGEIVFEPTGDVEVDTALELWREQIISLVSQGVSNDVVSLMLPQAYQYRWVAKFNVRSLRNFIKLRTNKSAHFHIVDVAKAMYEVIPEDYKYLFKDCINDS